MKNLIETAKATKVPEKYELRASDTITLSGVIVGLAPVIFTTASVLVAPGRFFYLGWILKGRKPLIYLAFWENPSTFKMV